MTGGRAQLTLGWRALGTQPGHVADSAELSLQLAAGTLSTFPVAVPGSVSDASGDPDALDWWFFTELDLAPSTGDEESALCFDGLATLAEVYLDDTLALTSESMFAAHRIDLSGFAGGPLRVAVCCRALAPRLAERRKPRARWRARLAAGNLRFYRTMLMGRAPGFAPGPPVVGPWRAVWVARRRVVAVEDVVLRVRVQGHAGRVELKARLRAIGSAPRPERAELELRGPGGSVHRAELSLGADHVKGGLDVGQAELWWPHTHGPSPLYDATLVLGRERVELGRVGFRTLEPVRELEEGLALRVNGVQLFARGAVWTPLHGALRPPETGELRDRLEKLVAAGMNMVRIPGTACYETADFHDLCDELGILVWQDLMFANLDYPESDPGFMEAVEQEVRAVLAALGRRPSLAVVCGSSEVAQQVAMVGLDPSLASGPLFGELIPRLVEEASLGAVYVPSAPWGGALPFRTDRGVASYFGVGGYMRPLEDARLAAVKFAAECLAFSNVPDREALAELAGPGGSPALQDARWKAGIPRDVGAGWDFEDVRDHYLRLLYGVDPAELRRVEPDRYLELGRIVTGEVMAEVLGEWRRADSTCAGAIILWLADLHPGAGWGLLDHRAEPKPAYHYVRRALAPVAVWMTDEGLNGIAVHAANDRPVPLDARLRLAFYRDGVRVDGADTELHLGAHESRTHDPEALLGRFVDASWAYRFGPPPHDLIVASLEHEGGLLSQAFRFPAGRPASRRTAAELGLEASLGLEGDGALRLHVASRCYVHGVTVSLPGFTCQEQYFSLEPGAPRMLLLRPSGAEGPATTGPGELAALNLESRMRLRSPDLVREPSI